MSSSPISLQPQHPRQTPDKPPQGAAPKPSTGPREATWYRHNGRLVCYSHSGQRWWYRATRTQELAYVPDEEFEETEPESDSENEPTSHTPLSNPFSFRLPGEKEEADIIFQY
jgi:hypothetical protein